jgi:hypothetical protein
VGAKSGPCWQAPGPRPCPLALLSLFGDIHRPVLQSSVWIFPLAGDGVWNSPGSYYLLFLRLDIIVLSKWNPAQPFPFSTLGSLILEIFLCLLLLLACLFHRLFHLLLFYASYAVLMNLKAIMFLVLPSGFITSLVILISNPQRFSQHLIIDSPYHLEPTTQIHNQALF